jgi:hypothetical protein
MLVGLLSYRTMTTGKEVPAFWRNTIHSPSEYYVQQIIHCLDTEGYYLNLHHLENLKTHGYVF